MGTQLEITELQKRQRRAIWEEASVIVSYINGNYLPSPTLLFSPGWTGTSPWTSMNWIRTFLSGSQPAGVLRTRGWILPCKPAVLEWVFMEN